MRNTNHPHPALLLTLFLTLSIAALTLADSSSQPAATAPALPRVSEREDIVPATDPASITDAPFYHPTTTTAPLTTQPAAQFRPISQGVKITMVFRYDDYGTLSDTQLETQLIEIFRKHHLSITFGVIPAFTRSDAVEPTDADLRYMSGKKVKLLKNAVNHGIVDAELHGLTHQKLFRDSIGPSEFTQLTEPQAEERIQIGRDMLQFYIGHSVSIFIPPWNRADNATVQAVEKLHFDAFSSDYDGPIIPESKLLFVPKTTDLPYVHDAITYAQTLPDPDLVIICLFHSYDLTGTTATFNVEQLNDLVQWITLQNDVQVDTLAQLAHSDPSLTAQRLTRFLAWTNAKPIHSLPEDKRRVIESVYRSESGLTTP